MGVYVRPDKAIRENIIVKMEEDRDAIQAAFAQSTHIEHSVDFISDPAGAIGGDVRIRSAGGNLTPHFGTCCCMAPSAPGVLVDIRLGNPGGPSILVAPVQISSTPGVPVPLAFIQGVVISQGTPICYILTEPAPGAGVTFPTMHVEYVKEIVPIAPPPP